jgi:hypothetical protein
MKKSSILAAVLAMGIATAATTACAFENEFHGMFSARWINSNFNRTATTDYGPNDFNYDPSGKNKNNYVANFVEQRTRLQYIAKANADLKLVTHFELDYSYWGNSSYAVGRNSGGAQGADSVNIETKSIYLDFNPVKALNVKMGMQPFADSFKGSVIDSDVAGVLLSSSYGKFSPSIGYFRFHDTGAGKDSVLGHLTNDMFMLDGKYEVSKALKIGAAYYFFRDNQAGTTNPIIGYDALGAPIFAKDPTTFTANANNDVKINVLGLNAEFTSGPLTLNGFFVYETGWNNTVNGKKTYVNAYEANIGAKIKAGPGTARFEALYVSGSGDAGRNAFYSSPGGEHGYYDNEMVILGRDKNAYTTDNSILDLTGNRGQGQMGAYFGYDLPVTQKLETAFNVGFAGIAHKNNKSMKNAATGKPNATNFLGTEVNAEANYKILDGLSTSFRVGYVFLGGHYDNVASNGTPENPYDAKLIFKYTF